MDMSEKKAGVSRIKRYGIPLLIIILGLLLSLTTFILARSLGPSKDTNTIQAGGG